MKVGLGDNFGPKFAPMKAYIELDAEPGETLDALKARVSKELWDYAIEQLEKFKGASEAEAYKKGRTA